MNQRKDWRSSAANTHQEEGDRICEDVLILVYKVKDALEKEEEKLIRGKHGGMEAPYTPVDFDSL